MVRRPSLLPILALGALSTAAYAADPLGPAANKFNAFTFGDFEYNNNDTDGPLAAGGQFKVNGAFQVNSLNLGATVGSMSNVGLLVGGNLVGPQNAGDLKIKGNAYVKGSISGGAAQYQNGSLFTGAAVDTSIFAQQLAFSTNQSAAIRAMASSYTIAGNGNNFNVNLANVATTVVGGQNVKRLSVAASTIQNNANATLDFSGQDANTTVLIDVIGTGPLTWNWSANFSNRNKMLWNFRDVSTLTIGQRDFSGSILAPATNVIVENGNVNGNVIASTLNVRNGKELHMGSNLTFNGAAPVPEPATLAALALGVGAVLRRRRRA